MHVLIAGEGGKIDVVIHSMTRHNYVLYHAKSVGQPSVCRQIVSWGRRGALENPAEPTADRYQAADHLSFKFCRDGP